MRAAGNRSMLVLCHPTRGAAVGPLIDRLEVAGDVRRSSDVAVLRELAGVDAVLIDWPDAVDADAATSLDRFVAAGGTAVLAGATLAAWSTHPRIAAMAGWTPDGRTVETELRLRAAEGGVFTARDAVHLLSEPPPGTRALLHATYRHASHLVAYDRHWGAGRFAYLGLGRAGTAYAHAEVQSVVVNALRGETALPTVRVGMLGFGALGTAHAAAISSVKGLEVSVVCDVSPRRREAAAALGVAAVSTESELLESDVDVVLVGTPPVLHAEASLRALAAGKHVVSEKPFALTLRECDAVIAAAAQRERMVTVVQNRRWDPDFVRLREVVTGGSIGDIFHAETFVGGHAHPCNYWHSEASISGGAVYDWGSHYVDWLLQLVAGPVRRVRCVSHKLMWHDVTNADHLTVELQFESGAQAFFTHSELAAARKPKWYVLGTGGAVVGDWQEVTLQRRGVEGEIDDEPAAASDSPARLSVHRPTDHGGTDVETLSVPPRDRAAFWRNVAAHLREGAPLAVTASQARRTVAVLEASVRSAAANGETVDLDV